MSEPVPQRIGDAERDRAAEYLREHLSVGRLTQEEFEERVTVALQAKTAGDLQPLFVDLPAPKPGQEIAAPAGTPWPAYQPPTGQPVRPPSSAPAPMPSNRVPNLLQALAWVAWVLFILSVVTNVGSWWLVAIPIVLSSVAGQQRSEQHRRERLWRSQQNPQLPSTDTDPSS